MHLISNKSSAKYSPSPLLKSKNAFGSSVSKNSVSKPNLRPETQRPNPINTSKTPQSTKQSGMIARAISNAKSTIQKLVSFPKVNEEDQAKLIGGKYVYYEKDLIGKGYSSHVYKGSHVGNPKSKNFAIKILDLSKIKGFLFDLLKKEISIHRNLDHPNIVKCFDVIQTETHFYLIQEYCSGGDLGSYINQRKNKITEGQALNIMSQIVDGYKYLVQQKILHRDLKPCNIFRCKMNESWKIGDFGFSCLSQEQPDDINVGTPIYMPPQSLQKSLYSHKSDFFSLGVIMFQIIYGKVPWFSKSESLLIRKMRENKIDFTAQKHSIVSPVIKKFIQKCCQVQIDSRMSIDDFLKLELYPRQNIKKDERKTSASRQSVSKIKDRKSSNKEETKISLQVLNPNENIRLSTKPSQKSQQSQQSQQSLKTNQSQQSSSYVNISKKNNQNSKNPITSRKMTESYTGDKVSKTSQYSTEAQTRVIHDFPTANSEEICKSNSEKLYKQNSFCKHLYFMIKNIDHFLLSRENKQLLTIVMYRHILYLLKKLKNTKFNYFQLKSWEIYKSSKEYMSFHKEVTVNFQRVQNEYFKHPKKKDIRLLREVDSKFKELDHQVEFNIKFYLKITEWLRELVQEFNGYITGKIVPIQQESNMNKKSTKDQSVSKARFSSPNAKSRQKSRQNKADTSKQKNKTSSKGQQSIKSKEESPMNTGQKIKAKLSKANSPKSEPLVNNFFNLLEEQNAKKESDAVNQNKNEILTEIEPKQTKQQTIKNQEYSNQVVLIPNSQKSQEDFIKVLKQDQQPEKNEPKSQGILMDSNQKQTNQVDCYSKLSNATLQALLSLCQYYYIMEQKIATNKDVHTSYSLIDLQHDGNEQNLLSLHRQYQKVAFKPQDIAKIVSLARYF